MTKKSLLGLALMLFLIIPTTSLYANAQSSQQFQLNGAGSTFVFPLMDKWRVEYNKINSNVQLNYQSIGSGAGIKLLTAKTVDFAASDAPLSAADAAKIPGTLTIPESIGAITVSYNISGMQSGLKLTGPVIASIFMGNITKWNDKMITELNPDASMPDQKISVIHRSDGSGTTFAFTDYLSTVSSDWKTGVGQGKSVPWPTGIGAQGNEGVAGVIEKTPYSIGYVELAYAFQNKMAYAFVQNADGSAFVEPSLTTTASAASAAATNLPQADGDWSKVSIVNQAGKDSYPISTFTYILVFKNLEQVNGMTQDKATAEINFLKWIINDGQQFSTPLLYVPLPDAVKKIDEQGLAQIQLAGNAVPEFGPIAGLVLVVAIISIIAISARTGLLMQRN
jgi:phosphate transport system substrate-binding protein